MHTPLRSRHSPLCSLSRLQKPLSQFAFYPWLFLSTPKDFTSFTACFSSFMPNPCSQPLSPLADAEIYPASLCAFAQFSKYVPNAPYIASPCSWLCIVFHNTRDCHSLPCGLVFWGVCKENPSGMLEPFGMLEDDNSQACGECLWSQLSGGGGRRIRHLRLFSAT